MPQTELCKCSTLRLAFETRTEARRHAPVFERPIDETFR
jgi:hypothetical protein